MAIGVDTSKWKPRRLAGTPAARSRNIISAAILTWAVVGGLYFHTSKWTLGLRKAAEKLYEDPIEVVERRQLMGLGVPLHQGDTIRKYMEYLERPDLPEQ